MKKIILVLAFATLSVFSFSQNIIGTWSGDLKAGNGISLAIVLNINALSSDSITMDSPDQAAYGIKVDEAIFTDSTFSIEIKSIKVKITGNIEPKNDSLYCDFTQMGNTQKIVMKRGYEPKPKKQTPKDFPYIVEEVTISNPETNVTLSGTLTAPYDYKCDKIVILVSGSGQQNRDEELFGHKPFLVLSDYLTRNNIAVIRYDDRGFAKSTGDYTNATTYDFSLDAESVVEFIKNDERLKNMKIGIIGHSEGGMIAPMVAARNENVDFVVMLAGPGIAISELMVKQNYDVMKSYGYDDEFAKKYSQYAAETYKILKNKKLTTDEQKSQIIEIQKLQLSMIPESSLIEMSTEDAAKTNAEMFFAPWMYYFINANPTDYLQKVHVPLLALNGDKDLQVNSSANLKGVEKAMKKAKNKNYKTLEMNGLNHLFQKCFFGSPTFYGRNEETFNENAMKEIVEWINEL